MASCAQGAEHVTAGDGAFPFVRMLGRVAIIGVNSAVGGSVTIVGTNVVFTPRDSGWVKTLNFGGGARWFIKDHFGVGFDVRWYKLSPVPVSATHPGAPRESLVTIGAGVVFK